jgi:hypothetical protein
MENFILIHDHSKKPADIYYGCPYCLFKLDPTATQVLQTKEIVFEEKKEPKKAFLKREIPTGCPQYFGYLSIHSKDANIPQECLICPKMLDCAKNNNQ